jgi:hypothetical protein
MGNIVGIKSILFIEDHRPLYKASVLNSPCLKKSTKTSILEVMLIHCHRHPNLLIYEITIRHLRESKIIDRQQL